MYETWSDVKETKGPEGREREERGCGEGGDEIVKLGEADTRVFR
jgi:hypothetical protein